MGTPCPMSNNTTQNLISFDEFIRLSRLKGADFGKGDPYNRLRYYIKTGLLPKASRKSFNGLPPSGALPIEAVDTLVEIDEKIKEGRSIQQIIKGAKNPVVNEEFSTPHPIEITPQNSLLPLEGGYNNSVNLGSFPAGNTASSDISALVAPELVPVNDDSGTTLRRRNFLPRIGLTKGRFFILGLEGMTLILGLIVLLSIYHLNTSKPVTSGSVVVDKNHLPKITAQEPGSTLGSSVQDGLLSVFVPTNLAGQLTAGGGIVTNDTDVNAGTGKLTASNVIYSLTAGANVSITGGQNPTISAVAASVNGTSNRISVSSGKVDIASNYAGQTSITTLGTVTTGTWEAGTISDPFVSDSLTISSSSSVDWLALTNFPTTCGAGNFVRAVGTTLTCALDQVGGSSPQNILQDGVFLQTASSLNFVTADVNVTSDSGTQVSISLPDTGVANGSYGSATQVATFTVDTKGRLTAAGNTTISLTDANVSDTLTIDSSSSVSATAINSGTLGNAGVTLALASFGSITGSLPDANVSNSLTLDNTSSVSATAINSGTLGNAGVTLALASFGSITGTVAVANGGTSISSYTIGDILYASGATTLSKLADVATGNVLISGGVGAAPSWGKVGLTTHVSGVLPIANGGTNGSAAPTNGGIAYGTGTAYAFTAAGGGTQCLLGGTPPVFGSCGAGSGGATISDGTNTVTAVTTENFNTYFTVSPNGGTVTAGITLKTGSVDNAILTNSSITFAGDSSSSATALGGTRTISGGNGLTSTDNGSGTLTVNVGAGTGILANANDVAVDQAFSPTWTGLHTFTPGSTNDTVFNGDNDSNLQIASTFSGTGPTINPIDITLTDNATAAGTANIVNIKNADNGANAGVPAALLHLDNANAAETVTNGLFVEQSGAGTLTSAIGIKQTSGTITNLLKYDNGTNTASILKPTLTGNQTYTLPDFSGTFAVSGNLGDALQFSSSLFDVKLGTTGGSSSANFSGLQKIYGNGLSLLPVLIPRF
ncbi:MAG TPA: hypothetical protein VLE47_02015 [Candidatus Saccharimonadales bacterium]|nr:hypothetical protein [Candidatus Saccharimonadales bacterium]